MKIISWNVNGLRAVHRKDAFLPFVKKYNPDILCLQEIKSRKEQNEIDLPDYEEFWNPAEQPGYSGTAIFVKKSPNLKILQVVNNFPENLAKKYNLNEDKFGDLNSEGRIITAEFEDFYIVNVYTPNSKPDLSRLALRHKKWDRAFLEYVKDLSKEKLAQGRSALGGKNVIFCGDLNVAHTEDDLAHPKENKGEHGFTKEEREGIDNIIKAGFIDTFREFKKGNGYYTWWSHFANARERNIGWRLDYFFANKKLLSKVLSSKILSEVFGSDHCPILLEIKN
ncbi:MAG: exodeoxyribonuclease III [Candidatus Zambryskibacteria bacterium]|nr:exodeoxyribonuclease III [Candidatus Zambryskibacteria bacterium]